MAKRWVIKLGSGLLTRKDGKVDRVQIGRIVDQVAGLHKRGIQVVLVTSGAVAAGMTAMGLEKRPKEARELQACATVGQPELMSEYGKHLRRHKLLGSQMLLTYWDLDSRACTRNARATLDLLLARKRFVPIINENDAIADEEIKVGDNDRLSAHVAALVGADLSHTTLDHALTRTFPGVGDADFGCEQLGRAYAGKVITRPMANPSLRQVDAVVMDDAGRHLLTLTTVLARP